MDFFDFESLPVQIEVESLESSRYTPPSQGSHQGYLSKCGNWDERVGGVDLIVDTLQRPIRLKSDGGQAPPQKGWVLVLRDGSCKTGYGWTLYGFSAAKLPKVEAFE